MKPIFRELLAGGAAAGFLIALSSQLSFLPLLGLAAAVYFGVRLAIPVEKPVEVASGVTRDELDAAKAEIWEQANRFDHFADRIGGEVAKRIRHIAQMTRDMIDHLKREPANFTLAKEFLDLHLPKSLRIVESYALLSRQPYLDEAGRSRLDEAQKTISLIEKAFETQHNRMLESDVRAFDVDLRVYEELLRLDGQLDDFQLTDSPAHEARSSEPSRSPDLPPPLPRGGRR